MKKEEIEIGMVFSSGDNPGLEYVAISILPDSVTLEKISQRSGGSNRHGVGYGWFDNYYRLRRKMRKKELAGYLTGDSFCNCEPGLYKATKEIVDTGFKTLASCGEIVKVAKVDCNRLAAPESYELAVRYQRFGFEEDFIFREANPLKNGCVHRFWQLFERIY